MLQDERRRCGRGIKSMERGVAVVRVEPPPSLRDRPICDCRGSACPPDRSHVERGTWRKSHRYIRRLPGLSADFKHAHKYRVHPVQQVSIGGVIRSLEAMEHVIPNVVDHLSRRTGDPTCFPIR